MLGFDTNRPPARPSSPFRGKPLPDGVEQRLGRDHYFCARDFLMSLYVIANISKKNVLVFPNQQYSSAPRKTTKIANVGKMADQQPIEPGGSKMLPQFRLA